jgi:hypothetical protein
MSLLFIIFYLVVGFCVMTVSYIFTDFFKPASDADPTIAIIFIIFWPGVILIGIMLTISNLIRSYLQWLTKMSRKG